MNDETTLAPPLPVPDTDSAPFWEALAEHRVVVQRCGDCGHAQLYFRAMCRRCWSRDVETTDVSGNGRVYSYTVVRRVGHPYLSTQVPYVLAIVELDEGPRIIGRVDVDDVDSVTCDLPVTPVFHDFEGASLLHFTPA